MWCYSEVVRIREGQLLSSVNPQPFDRGGFSPDRAGVRGVNKDNAVDSVALLVETEKKPSTVRVAQVIAHTRALVLRKALRRNFQARDPFCGCFSHLVD